MNFFEFVRTSEKVEVPEGILFDLNDNNNSGLTTLVPAGEPQVDRGLQVSGGGHRAGEVFLVYPLDEKGPVPTSSVDVHLLRVIVQVRGGSERLNGHLMSTGCSVLGTNLDKRCSVFI